MVTSRYDCQRGAVITPGHGNIEVNAIRIVFQPHIAVKGIIVMSVRPYHAKMKHRLIVEWIPGNQWCTTNLSDPIFDVGNGDRKTGDRNQFSLFNSGQV